MTGYVGGDPYESPSFGKSLSLRVDGGVNAISINPSGRDVVLASRQGLHIIDLDDPFSPPRWLRHITPWQVADVQWSPHPAKPYWVISTSNQKAIIWNLARSSDNAIEHVLHKHFRAISDINFSHLHPDILATCSIDTYVHAWDMRSPNRPFYTTRDWRSGASQVKWNYIDQNVLASAHGNDVTIWDLRKGSTPLGKLVGHGSSVNSIDFNRFKKTEIMTGSNDGTVKFWDYSVSCTTAKKTIKADFPIWRGRYLPFGEGCAIMPTFGGKNSVYIASLAGKENEENTDTKLQPLYAFKGHTDRVTDFLWRSRHTYNTNVDDRDFQLVTWSKDCDLRLWPVPDIVLNKVGFDRNKSLDQRMHNYEYVTYNKEPERAHVENKVDSYKRIKETFVTTSGLKKSKDLSHITWLSGVRMNHSDSSENIFKEKTIQNLGEEVSLVGHKFPKIIFEKISVSTGDLIITLNGPWASDNADEYVFLRIYVKVPSEYPLKGNLPNFLIEDNGNLTQDQRQEILRSLKSITQRYTDAGLYCLEPCLRLLLGEKVNLDDISQDEEPLLNFDIDDFEGLSSAPSSDNNSQYPTESSSDSEQDDYSNVLLSTKNLEGDALSEKDSAFDSTPVPNECGAVWSPTGQLFCFFVSETRQEKKQQAILRLTSRDNAKQNKIVKSYPKPWVENESLLGADPANKILRPKTYLETISHTVSGQGNSNYSSDNDSSSYDSSDSFDEDWSDILRNEIVVRTKLPALHGNFTKNFGSVQSESGKTIDSTKKHINIVFSQNFSFLIPERKELALEYQLTSLNGDLEKVSRNNALVAEKFNLEEISHCWQILSDLLMTNQDENPYNLKWDNHPMGIKWFLKEAISYFEKQKNIQMISMICCVVANELFRAQSSPKTEESEEKMEQTVHSIVTFKMNDSGDSWRNESHSQYSNSMTSSYLEAMKKNRQSPDEISIKSEDYFSARHHNYGNKIQSLSPPLSTAMQPGIILSRSQGYRANVPDIYVQLVHDDVLEAIADPVRHLMDPDDAKKFRSYSYQYAKLLFRWGLPLERVEMIKFSYITKQEDSKKSVSHLADDQEDSFGGLTVAWINEYKNNIASQHCNYCGLKVTRSVFVCQKCEHIMHAACAREWWKHSSECSSGCGCHCLEHIKSF